MQHYVAFWNLENLFGPEVHPPRIPWVQEQVRRSLVGWSPALYQRKLDQLARIIRQMKGGRGPDILGVCEVEDKAVLDDLARTLRAVLPARDYEVIHATNDHSSRGIDTAFVYDAGLFSVDPKLVFNHWVMRRTGTRDILQATFRRRGNHKQLIVMANHWPARVRGEGAETSAGFRATAGETLSYWHGQIFEHAPKQARTPVIAIGDFNDDPWDRSVTLNALATRERGDVERARSAMFYNMSWEYQTTPATDWKGGARVLEGSLYYNNDGNLFDQVLVNRPLLDGDTDSEFKLVAGSAGLFAPPEMVSHKVGEGPIRFGLPEGNPAEKVNIDGYSDHFPVGVTVAEV